MGRKRKSLETETQGPQHTVIYAEHYFLVFPRILGFCEKNFNTLRTGDADLRFHITTVQDG
jgi:hypothetical protein